MRVTGYARFLLGVGCSFAWAVTVAQGQSNIVITSFQSNGELTFSAPIGTNCAIEWASNPTSGWSRSWSTLSSMSMVSTTRTVKVPMFYRVVYAPSSSLLVFPFENISNLGPIRAAYSVTPDCPWGFVHDGIDFYPTVDLKPVVAVASGTVSGVQLYNAGTNWAVDVGIRHQENLLSGYTFMTMSGSESYGSSQLASIVVTANQAVVQGEIIGYLNTPSTNSHVHFSLIANGNTTCPASYFNSNAVTSVLYLLDLQWPGAAMCY